MVKKILISFLVGIILVFGVLNDVKADSCGVTANSGATGAGSGFRINSVVNTSGLTKGAAYQLVVSGATALPQVAANFNADGSTQQYSYDLNAGSNGQQVKVEIIDSDGNLVCNTNLTLSNSSPNNNNNLPPLPGNGAPVTAVNQPTCAGGKGIDTAIGCVPISSESALVGFFLKWGLGIGGGIAFLLILISGFMIMTSRGDPKRLQAGQELMTSAIAGVLLLVFSLVILRIIGFDILNIAFFK